MKVGVFFTGAADRPVSSLLRLCKAENIEATGYRLKNQWQRIDLEEASFNFGSLSHAFVRGTADVLGAGWLPLVAGFVLGRERPIVLLGPLEDTSLPGYLKQLPLFSQQEQLISYLREEKTLAQRRNTIEAAREELRAAGLAETERAFAGAVADGDALAVENFLRIGFSPDVQDSKEVPLLVMAIRNDRKEVAQSLLARGADPNAVSGDRGTSAIMESASLGEPEVVQLLLSHGADPNIKSKSGRTALMLAVSEGHREVTLALLAAGADREVVDDLGMTALAYAKLFKLEDLFEAPEQT